jgi:hypothetical protein
MVSVEVSGFWRFIRAQHKTDFSLKSSLLYHTVRTWPNGLSTKLGSPPMTPHYHRSWEQPWEARSTFDRWTVWFPPPEVAAQLLYFLLQCHVERPLTTSALVVIPRVMQKRWSRPSRHVLEVGSYQRDCVPFAHRSLLTIPVVVLLIPCHVCVLPKHRLDPVAPTALRLHHRQQATLVRGVLEAIDGY